MTRIRLSSVAIALPSLLCLCLIAVAGGQETSDTTTALLPDSTTGEIRGTLISKATKLPLQIVPGLLRDKVEGEEEAEIDRLMDLMETTPDSTCGFHWVKVLPGHYHLFTYEIGLVTPGFDVVAGEIVDLGEVEVEKGRRQP